MIDVLIAGGGPVGLSLAADLARLNVSFRIIDKKPEPEKYSKAANFWPRTQEVTHAMGYGHHVYGHSTLVKTTYVYAFGKHIGTVPQGPYNSPFPHVRSINQGQVEHIIVHHLAELGHQVDRGYSLVSLRQHSDHVAATVEDAHGRQEVIQCRYLVGCEGVRSVAREAVGIHVEPQTLPGRALRQTDAKLTWKRPKDEVFHFFIDQDRFCGVVAMPGGYHRIFMCQPEGEIPDRKPELNEILPDFRKLVGDETATLTDPIWLTHGKFYYGYAPRLLEGRVLLAGDAGHFSLPIGGQGMNTGIQDAFNLGWKLAWVLQGKADSSLLSTYSLERQRVKQELCDDQVDNFKKLMYTQPLRKWVMTTLGPLIMRFQQGIELRGRDETQLSINYPASPLTVDKLSTGGVKAGDRCPDANVVDAGQGGDVRLFSKIYGASLTLLAFDNGELESTSNYLLNLSTRLAAFGQLQTGIISASGHITHLAATPVLLDLTRDAHKAYGVKDPTVYLIRPDGHVGFRGGLNSASELMAYLDQFFLPYPVAEPQSTATSEHSFRNL